VSFTAESRETESKETWPDRNRQEKSRKTLSYTLGELEELENVTAMSRSLIPNELIGRRDEEAQERDVSPSTRHTNAISAMRQVSTPRQASSGFLSSLPTSEGINESYSDKPILANAAPSAPITKLENVTELQRSLISPELLKKNKKKFKSSSKSLQTSFRCPKCGIETHQKVSSKGLKKFSKKSNLPHPITNESVQEGRCLTCFPLAKEEITSGTIVDRAADGESVISNVTSGTRIDRGDGMKGTYDGELNSNNERDGRGIMTWDNGHLYNGEWRDDQRHGYGAYIFPDGSHFIGEFRSGRMEGKGVYEYATGDKYVGQYKNNKREGWGKYQYASGAEYVGQFRENKRDGHGTYAYPNLGGLYEGDWRDDKQEGHGTETSRTGDWYEGEFRDGMKDGIGTYHYVTGDSYNGEWRRDQREGHGTYFHKKTGTQYIGEFRNGVRDGKCTRLLSDGTFEVGFYSEGKRVREGLRWSQDRTKAFLLVGESVQNELPLEEADRIAKGLGLATPKHYDEE